MRVKKQSKKRSNTKPGMSRNKPGILLGVAGNVAMGVALGLVFALIVVHVPSFGVAGFIASSADPERAIAMFVGTVAFAFGIGAAFTGAILTMEDS
jgi:hypothetical protein